jgi:hypothetical protein
VTVSRGVLRPSGSDAGAAITAIEEKNKTIKASWNFMPDYCSGRTPQLLYDDVDESVRHDNHFRDLFTTEKGLYLLVRKR